MQQFLIIRNFKKSPGRCVTRLNGQHHFIYSNTKSNSKNCQVLSNKKVKGGEENCILLQNLQEETWLMIPHNDQLQNFILR